MTGPDEFKVAADCAVERSHQHTPGSNGERIHINAALLLQAVAIASASGWSPLETRLVTEAAGELAGAYLNPEEA